MKKHVLVFIALLLLAVVVTATVLNSNKKATLANKEKKECVYKGALTTRTSTFACY